MDDFSDYFEGGIDNYDLHHDLELELGNDLFYNDAAFPALPDVVDHLPYQFEDHDDYEREYYAATEQGSVADDVEPDHDDVDNQSVSESDDSGTQPRSPRYGSEIPESIDGSIVAPSLSSIGSEVPLPRDYHFSHHNISSDDDSEEEQEEHLPQYDIPFHGLQQDSDRESEEREESDYGSLPPSEADPVHHYDEDERVEDFSQEEDEDEDQSSDDDDEIRAPSVRWDPIGQVDELSDDELLQIVHEIEDFSDHEPDDLSDNEVLARRYAVSLDSSSESEQSGTESEDDDESLRSASQDEASPRHQLYSDDEGSISGDSANSPRSPTTSPSEGDSPPQLGPPGFREGFDVFRQERQRLQQIHQEHERLQQDLRQLRGRANFNNFPPPLARRPNAHNIDYFLDQLPAPQRDANDRLAQMEMDLERGRQQRRRAAPSPRRGAAAPPNRPHQQQQREPAFIDLTGESDSPPPEVIALPDAPRFAGRAAAANNNHPFAPNRNNPRRNHHAPPRRAPSFARSDGSFLGPGGAQVIDLTDDGPELDAAPPPPRFARPRGRRAPADIIEHQAEHDEGLRGPHRQDNVPWGAANMNAFIRHYVAGIPGIPRIPGADFLHQMRVRLGGNLGDYDVEIIGEQPINGGHNHNHHHAHNHHHHFPGGPAHFPGMENPLADHPVDFNYGANGFEEPPARAKPAHIAPPEPREGFTRATADDAVVICPSCEQELEYDPDDENDGSRPPPAKKARTTKKDREEHHFWAVKACGHVYCRSCFENRRPTKVTAGMTHFRVADKKVLCAVDDCTSDVGAKTNWVGIFL